MAEVVVQGKPVAPPTPAPPTKQYQVKPNAKLFVHDLGRVAYDGESVSLTDSAAHAFRDKLVQTPQLQQTVARVNNQGRPTANTQDDTKRSEATQHAAAEAPKHPTPEGPKTPDPVQTPNQPAVLPKP